MPRYSIEDGAVQRVLMMDTDGEVISSLSTTSDYFVEVARGNIEGVVTFEKYGKNPSISTATTPEDIWSSGGTYTGFPTGSPETMEIFSSDVNDTLLGTGARSVTVFNLLDGNGAAMPDVTVNLNGTTPVSLGPSTYYRGGTRMKVRSAGSNGANIGEITLRHTTTTANIFGVIAAGANQTSIAAYTVPLGKTVYATASVQLARANGNGGSASMRLSVRLHGEVFQPVINPEVTNSSPYRSLPSVYFCFKERSDVKFTCVSVSDNNTIITAELGVIMADN